MANKLPNLLFHAQSSLSVEKTEREERKKKKVGGGGYGAGKIVGMQN